MHLKMKARFPVTQASPQSHIVGRGVGSLVVRTPPSRLIAARAEFDEGAAQVKRLLSRDREDLTNYEELESAFSRLPQDEKLEEDNRQGQQLSKLQDEKNDNDTVSPSSPSSPSSSSVKQSTTKSTAASFSTKLSGSVMSPFGSSAQMYSPVQENLPSPKTKVQGDEKWWSNISLTQVFILLSFTLIIGLMISTFFFVVNVGAVRFNE